MGRKDTVSRCYEILNNLQQTLDYDLGNYTDQQVEELGIILSNTSTKIKQIK